MFLKKIILFKNICFYVIFDGGWEIILGLQQNRKKIISEKSQKLLLFQWVLIYLFSFLVIFSFHFIQSDYFWVNILKIIFGTSVFLIVLLIKQLDDLTIFGKDFSKKIANDVIRINDEVDKKELEKNKKF